MKAGVLPRADGRIVTEAEVEAALDWLRDNAAAIGKAAERSRGAAGMIKHVEALCFKMSEGKTEGARKSDARTTDRYVDAVTEDAIAYGELERMKALREAAALKIEVWRTQSSNFRSMKL
jgi:hypothetical protein